MNAFDDKPVVMPAPFDPFVNAPTLHFSSTKPITLEDLKHAIAKGTKPRPVIGWSEPA